jgi:hypothetical protein
VRRVAGQIQPQDFRSEWYKLFDEFLIASILDLILKVRVQF